jgi:DNA-binding HxlR family transcriptional regulator
MRRAYSCYIGTSVGTFGGKWKPFILTQLLDGTMRFGALHRNIQSGISQKVLTQQLKELEEDGIVRREVFPEVPPRVEYSLTEYGHTLRPVLEALQAWGKLHYERARLPKPEEAECAPA